MLRSLHLKNFRGFKDHHIEFRQLTVAVGKNNAGKSTIVEALRLLSVVTNRFKNLAFETAPSWLEIPVRNKVVSPSLKGISFESRNVCYQYSDPPAIMDAIFANGVRIKIYVGSRDKRIYATIFGRDKNPVATKGQAKKVLLNEVHIMPPVGPPAHDERILQEEYVRSNLFSNLASIHFRNQLYYLKYEHFDDFVALAEETWPDLRIREIEREGIGLSLLVQDGSHVAEIAWMGHGLQAWLQTIWFLSRVPANSTVILDEPDVYLHADLQRKIIRLLKRRYNQVIVATHSIEIMAEVDPDSILVIDKQRSSSKFAASLPAVQRVIEHIGGVHNLQLARLWTSKRFLMVEGDDLEIIKIFQDKLFPDSEFPFDILPGASIGGFGNWRHAAGVAMGFRNAADEPIACYLILDRDYHTQEEIDDIKRAARDQGLNLHVWLKKELENYLVIPPAIARLIGKKLRSGACAPHASVVERVIEIVCEEAKDELFDAIANEIRAWNRTIQLPQANRSARKIIGESWSSLAGKTSIVSGKYLLSRLSAWSKEEYGVSFGPLALARELHLAEIDGEIREVVASIETAEPFT